MDNAGYSFEAPGTILGVKPFFFASQDAIAGDAFGIFDQAVAGLRKDSKADKPKEVARLLGALKQEICPNLMGYELVNQSHSLHLIVGREEYEFEMWWPQSLKDPEKIAEPCCAVFVANSADNVRHIEFQYRPSAMLIDTRRANLPGVVVTHQIRKGLLGGIKKVENSMSHLCEGANIKGNAYVRCQEKYADNAPTDDVLRNIRDIARGEKKHTPQDALELAHILDSNITAAQLIVRDRGAR